MTNQLWSNELLDEVKENADPLADNTITQILDSQELEVVNQCLQLLQQDDQPIPNQAPPELVEYLKSTSSLPEWADPNKMNLAQKFFQTHSPSFGVALLFGSLPILYAGKLGGAQVLAATGQLVHHFQRRVGETLKFLINIMGDNNFHQNDAGIRTLQKVRLMHASIRYYIKRAPGAWNPKENWGVPINQEELVGTLLAFSEVAMQGLEKLGVEISEEEGAAYLHLWTVFGHQLGIDHRLFPQNRESAKELWNLIAERNFGPSEAGQILAQAHVEFLKELIPGHFFDGLANSLMKYLMGKTITENYLGIDKPGWTQILILFIKGLFGLRDDLIEDSALYAKLAQRDGNLVLEGLEKYWSKGDSVPFQIPQSLTKAK